MASLQTCAGLSREGSTTYPYDYTFTLGGQSTTVPVFASSMCQEPSAGNCYTDLEGAAGADTQVEALCVMQDGSLHPTISGQTWPVGTLLGYSLQSQGAVNEPTNLCTARGDSNCFWGIDVDSNGTSCCSNQVGVWVDSQFHGPDDISQYCTADTVPQNGCQPCAEGTVPVVVATSTNASNPPGAQNVTWFQCLPRQLPVTLDCSTATNSCNDNSASLTWIITRDGGTMQVAAGTVAVYSGATGSTYLQPGETITLTGHSSCCCLRGLGPLHHMATGPTSWDYDGQWSIIRENPTYYVPTGNMPTLAITFTGGPSCSGTSCKNGNMTIGGQLQVNQ